MRKESLSTQGVYTRNFGKKRSPTKKNPKHPQKTPNPYKATLNPQTRLVFAPAKPNASNIKVERTFQVFSLPPPLRFQNRTPENLSLFKHALSNLSLFNVTQQIHKPFLITPNGDGNIFL
jgi:hypothetical protein